jgi:hypothetical protein
MIHRVPIITGCGYEGPALSFRVILQGWPNKYVVLYGWRIFNKDKKFPDIPSSDMCKFLYVLAMTPFVNRNKRISYTNIPSSTVQYQLQ